MLENRNILLGVTGSIALYKSVELARRLSDEGARVSVVMTESASRFVSPLTFEAVLGEKAHTGLFDGYLDHIRLVRNSHLLLIAPLTANTLNKLASGIADNLLSTLWLANTGPALMAPAMNSAMYRHPVVQRNIQTLSSMGVQFIGPATGSLACGEEGEGRMADIVDIIEAAQSCLSPKDLSGHRIVVTAGPTREPLDPVRFLSNRSSGKMGFAVAQAAQWRGAEVTLICGPSAQRPPAQVRVIQVERAAEMEQAVKKNLPKATALVMAAAVSDFSPASERKRKIPKTGRFSLELTQTPDILERIGRKKGSLLLVGFAAETGRDTKRAGEKLRNKNLDLLVLNDITREGAGFDTDTNIVTIIDKRGETTDYPLMKKQEVANIILDRIVAFRGPGRS